MSPQRIGILTGGGDCPGLNAVIRAVTKDAILSGIEVIGIHDGFLGLIEDRVHPLTYDEVSNILTIGGTILGTSNKANPIQFATGEDASGNPIFEDVSDRCMASIERHGLEGLVLVGGDGTLTCAQPFIQRGVPCVGVPKTIDNDIYGTDLSFGFLTAVSIATEALDRVHTTAASHHRAMVVEVMGRNAGWIALNAGLAAGADLILIPEMPFREQRICEFIRDRQAQGKRFSIVVVAEGASAIDGEVSISRTDPTSPDPIRYGGISERVAALIEDCTGIESRAIILGHVQRGGSPIAADRILGTQYGHRAMELVRAGTWNRMVALQNGSLTDVDIELPAGKQRTIPLDDPLIATARAVNTHFGDA